MKWRCVIPHIPVALNILWGRHWSAKHKEAKRWKRFVRFHVGPKRPKQRRPVTCRITVFRPRRQDEGNREGSVKGLVDALVAAGWIRDDHPKWLKLTVVEAPERRRGRHRTVIEIEEEKRK